MIGIEVGTSKLFAVSIQKPIEYAYTEECLDVVEAIPALTNLTMLGDIKGYLDESYMDSTLDDEPNTLDEGYERDSMYEIAYDVSEWNPKAMSSYPTKKGRRYLLVSTLRTRFHAISN
jgi:hypothetical protein